MKRSIAAAALALAVLLPPPQLAGAQQARPHAEPASQPERPRRRIIITPGYHFYRQCADGYREVWRPYWHESVVTPYMHCWWVRG